MKLVKSKIEVRAEIARLKSAGARVGLVPTMGYFHEGHLSLMRISRRQADYTVVSLFVNPIQFAPGEDLEGYPRDPERDLDFPVEIVAGPTVREPDGLALSSRNLYLSKEERRRAPDLYRGLQAAARALAEPGAELAGVLESVRREIERNTGGQVEYISAVDNDMAEVKQASDCRYLATALQLGSTRLIDNVDVNTGDLSN